MTKIDKKFVIAIDGAAATGKSVLAKGIAQKLGILYIDTGAMYRAAGYYFITKRNIKEYRLNKYKIKIYWWRNYSLSKRKRYYIVYTNRRNFNGGIKYI